MAEKEHKWAQNVAGKYYVDDQCIACDACVVEAPNFFEMNDDDGHAYVKKQPTNQEEVEEAENALSACPVDSIGNDGEE